MGIQERIRDIEAEMARTQKNKATEGHLGSLKARLAKLKTEMIAENTSTGGGGEGFAVPSNGDGRVALIGFPSVGKSSLLSTLTGTESLVAAYEFTTLECIPGNMIINDTRIQLLDLPGIIEGAAQGKGRGREVIAVARSADMVLIILDAGKEHVNRHREILEGELESVGIRLNKSPPDISFSKKSDGGVKFNSIVPLTKLGADPSDTVYRILHEYKIHHCELLFRQDYGVDELIDIIEGNRRYLKCLYVYNKIDTVTIQDVDRLARMDNSLVISVWLKLNLEELKEKIWNYLEFVRIYTKRRGQGPDLQSPVILSAQRGGIDIQSLAGSISSDLLSLFKYAFVWGHSAIHQPQRTGLSHVLMDEDVVQLSTKTVSQQRKEKGYGRKVQLYNNEIGRKRREKKKKKRKP